MLAGGGFDRLQADHGGNVGKPDVDATATDTGAQLFEGMGDYRRELSTDSSEARAYLTQALVWLQAFNHDEAIRSFKEAARLDPKCAIAWWGVAYAEGPNYNDPLIDEARNRRSWDALQHALARLDHASPVERELIMALKARCAKDLPEDLTPLNRAYADAMGEVWRKHPEDADIGMLYAEALMVITPWELYNENREAAEGTAEIEALLERVLKLNPNLPGANHLYIHAVEMSKTPERGLEAAERLATLVPGSGHLRHMPSHIYTRTARWDNTIEQGRLAAEVNKRYLELSPKQGVQFAYFIHDDHILAYSAMMVGQESVAMEAARRMWEIVPENQIEQLAPWIDPWMCSIFDVQKRFGRWDALLAEPAPPASLPYTTAMWHAHRAVSLAAKGGLATEPAEKDRYFAEAEKEHEAYRAIIENFPPEVVRAGDTLEEVLARLEVINLFVPAEIALQKGNLEKAIELLRKSVAAEDALSYGGEPPEYLQPIRHTLGAVYLKAGRFAEAEKVFREDQAEFPGNGWSLDGLVRALDRQQKTDEADQLRERLKVVWAKADHPPTSPCLCIPDP
jgi:tetratricopeptide (TPR) repeat protein